MFQPRLGVSLHTVSPELTEDAVNAVGCSRIATLEVSARLFQDEERSRALDLVGGMCSDSETSVATVHALFGGARDFSVLDRTAQEEALRETIDALDLVVALDADMVVVHASAEPIEEAERGDRLEQSRKALAQIAERCAEIGKKVAVELLPRTCLGNSVEELRELLRGLDEEVCGVCLDTNHLMDRYATLPDVVRQLGNRLITLHLSDYDGVDEKHELPGKGVTDWKGFLEALQDVEYDGPFNYECKLEGETPEERILSVERNFDWLCSLVGQ